MDISIIAIGDELLIGQVTDTNSGEIAHIINPDGWNVRSIRTVGDNSGDIKKAITLAMQETDVVLTTGGLGPTKDDITKQTLCDYFGGEMIYDKSVEQNVLEVIAKRNLKINDLTAAQAYVPSSCRVIQNKVGTAPLMWFEKDGKVLVSMPGVPFEMEEMLKTEVFPQLKQRFPRHDYIEYRTFIVIDHSESLLAQKLENFEKSLPENMHLAYLPKPGIVRLRLTGISGDKFGLSKQMNESSNELDDILGRSIICKEDKMPAEILGDILRAQQKTVSTAESCTGGNIAREITSISGSSDYYKGSIVSYANSVKEIQLGVAASDIEQFGAVSEEVVRQMAAGAIERLQTDCAIATSGVAGPTGGTAEKPVGTVWIASACNGIIEARKFHFAGNRSRVINHATTMAEIMLIKQLTER